MVWLVPLYDQTVKTLQEHGAMRNYRENVCAVPKVIFVLPQPSHILAWSWETLQIPVERHRTAGGRMD